jgi:chromate transporter
VRAAVNGVTAAAAGAIGGSAVVLGRRAVLDPPTIAIFALALILLTRSRWKIPEPLVILAAGIAGIALHGVHA